ncbi:glycoside hydrolase [Niabella pedocola]|uniref:Glycoside hydrolase n=1 Tax=Niabella pedocola TaxID=1752077 RepID=A0ABS8PN52_9BACT|nr:sialidase family protein [Niabella pedocola]MCD2422549.1 glycoside hydrolase [Niabella pedocola]
MSFFSEMNALMSVSATLRLRIMMAGILALICSCAAHKQYAGTNAPVRNVVMQLSPGPDNPRNSEGAFITLKDGRILFVYSHYTGTRSGDHDPAYLAGRFSSDGGKTWTTDDVKIVAQEGNMNVMSVSLLRLKNGEIALFYLKKNSTVDCIPMVRFSKDEAKTWTDPIPCITNRKGYFVLNNDRVIQLDNGRLMMAVALHTSPETPKWSDRAALFAYYSDDNGRSWTQGKQVPVPDGVITQEPGLVALKGGRVMMFIRASGGSQYVSYSEDQGRSWINAAPYNLKSPLSPASIKRIPSTGDLVAVWNNNDGTDPQLKGKRTPLTMAISGDEGRTWKQTTNLETDPDGWYCYIAIHFYKDNILLGYCAGSQKAKTYLSVTDVCRVSLKTLYKK